jgi:hypothetical protein
VPGDTGFDSEQSGAEGAQAGGANVPFVGADLNPHTGVPGDTGIDLGDPGVAGGQAGKTDIGQTDDHGNTNFPGDTGIDEDVMDQSGSAGAATVVTPGPSGGPVHGVPGDTGGDADPAAAPGAADLGGADEAGNAGQNAPGAPPASAVLSDLSAGTGGDAGPSGDTGVADAGTAADSAGLPGGTDLGQVDDAGDAFHGVPGDTGQPDLGATADSAGLPGGTDLGQVDDAGNAVHDVPGVTADNPAGNPFLNDLSTGTTGDGDPGQPVDQADGSHDIPDVDPNSPEGGGFLGGLFGGAGDAANSAGLAHNLPDEGQAGAVDPGQSSDHAGIPLLNDLAAGLTGNTDPGAAGDPGVQPASGVSGLVSSFDHMLNPDAGSAASAAGGEGGAGFARDISGLASTFDKGLGSVADNFGQTGHGVVDPGAVGGLDHPAAADSASAAAGADHGAGLSSGVSGMVSSFDRTLHPDVGHAASVAGGDGVINDPGSNLHSLSTAQPTIVDPGASGGLSQAATAHTPPTHPQPAPGAEIKTTGHYGGETPTHVPVEHAAVVPTESYAQPAHEGAVVEHSTTTEGEEHNYSAQEPAHEYAADAGGTGGAESYEHHGL